VIEIKIANIARQSLLLLLCGGAMGGLGNAILNPPPTKSSLRAPTAFDFPQTISLSNWQMLESKKLTAHSFPNGMVAKGHYYRYQHHPHPIEIEVRYITDGVANRPTVDAMLPIFTKLPATVLQANTLKQQPNLGFYSLFVAQDTVYFSTCINPHGITTVTGDQFHTNSNPNLLSNLPIDRLLPWLLGQQTLRDSRCIWTILSTPIDRAAPNDSIKSLETIGVNWIRWWQVHFPAE
jgi:cyanosortase A-associated protein